MTTLTILPNGLQEPLVTDRAHFRINRLFCEFSRALTASFEQ